MGAFAPAALALPPPPYAVFDIGMSRPGLKAPSEPLVGVTDTRRDNRTTGWGITLGWRFSEHLAVEGAYLQLGEARLRATVADELDVTDARYRVATRGALVAMAGTLPVHERVALEGRAGFYWGSTETRFSGRTSGPLGDQKFNYKLDTDSKIGLAVGVGAVFGFNETWGMRVGFDFLDKALGKDAKRASVGVRFNWP